MSHTPTASRWFLFLLCTSALCAASTTTLFAERQRGTPVTITGQVVDETGSVLPGVAVLVRHAGLKREQTAFTDGSGRFTVPQLLAGSYAVTASLAGFETLLLESVDVRCSEQSPRSSRRDTDRAT